MDGLQFDKADFAGGSSGAAVVCAGCQAALDSPYFQINGHSFCASCKANVERDLGGTPGPGGFVKAVIGGVAGGIAGAVLYYLVRAVSGYEVGLIAIAVGFLVGKGVRWGTGGRGGRLYQVLAVGLTYLAIVSTYVPAVIRGLNDAQPPPSASTPVEGTAAPGPTAAATRAPVGSLAGLFIGLVLFVVLIVALPFLGGFANIIGLVIIGIGLYEAWKINRRLPLAISGPIPVRATDPAPWPLPAPPAIPSSAPDA
jgi:hypothetical protein